MAEIKIRFDLTFSRRFLTAVGAAAMMLCAVPELESESVTLSTYYPAPSGVYTNMITTGNTYLARDGGNASMVGIGLINPTVKLDIAQNGAMKVGNAYLSSGGDFAHLANNEWYNGAAWSTNGSAGALIQLTGQSVNFYTHDNTGATHVLTMTVDSGGSMRAGDSVVSAKLNCVDTIFGIGITNCPVGQYATFASGVLNKKSFGSGTSDPTGTMLCCPCPVGGCPL